MLLYNKFGLYEEESQNTIFIAIGPRLSCFICWVIEAGVLKLQVKFNKI